eukprot:1160804-Pelagomonas_calceolata.AAC.26
MPWSADPSEAPALRYRPTQAKPALDASQSKPDPSEAPALRYRSTQVKPALDASQSKPGTHPRRHGLQVQARHQPDHSPVCGSIYIYHLSQVVLVQASAHADPSASSCGKAGRQGRRARLGGRVESGRGPLDDS